MMHERERWTRETWPAECLRQSIEKVKQSTEGTRHDVLIGAACRVADYVAAGDLVRAATETALLEAGAVVGLTGKREKEARRCIKHGLDKGVATRAWYPDSGGHEPTIRRYRWVNGRILLSTVHVRVVRDDEPTELLTCQGTSDETRITLFPNTKQTQGTSEAWTWTKVAEMVAEPHEWPSNGKGGLPLWSWSEYEDDSRGQRDDGLDDAGNVKQRPAHVSKLHALVLDYDDEPGWSLERVKEWWGTVRYVAHTSANHNTEKPTSGAPRPALPRGRVIVALSRPVTVNEHRKIGEWALTCGRGVIGQKEIRDPLRAYFVPAQAPGGYEHEANLVGSVLNVDALLLELEEQQTQAEDEVGKNEPDVGVLGRLDVTEDGTARNTLRNVVEVLDGDPRWKGRLTYCAFSYRELMDGHAVTDASEVEAVVWMSRVYDMNPSVQMVHHAIQAVCSRHELHPVRAFLAPLVWDGKPRLVQLLRRMGCESTPDGLSEIYGKRWCISAVARVMEPGCQADSALIFAGAKGLGKTSAFRVLCGIQWHAESSLKMGDKDAYQQLHGVWIYELGELDSLRRSEVSAVKQFLTSRYDKFRASYGRNTGSYARQCVFAGTTNEVTFLPENDRRWWIRRVVQKADMDWLVANREQVWAEAKHLYEKGEQWHLTDDEAARQHADVAAYRHEDPWEQVISLWAARTYTVKTTIHEVLKQAIGRREDQLEKADEMRAGRVMSELGWTKGARSNGATHWHAPTVAPVAPTVAPFGERCD